jgi:hypothetical protein
MAEGNICAALLRFGQARKIGGLHHSGLAPLRLLWARRDFKWSERHMYAHFFEGFEATEPCVLSLEPIAAVGYPPTHKENRDSGCQRPPEWQNEIGDQPQSHEGDPKDFPFHYPILYGLVRFPAFVNGSSNRS